MKYDKKPVPGYEDKYYLDPEIMRVVNKKTGRPLKPQLDGAGYADVQLWRHNKGTHKRLHKLFAEAYIPNPDNLPEVNHKDEDPTNFQLDNLEWCTHPYNINYGTANERRGRSISKAKKGKSQPWVAESRGIPVVAIDGWGNETEYPSAREAARRLDLDQSTITAVVNGRKKTCGGYRFRKVKQD